MNKYTEMQKTIYDAHAKGWAVDNRDPVVGSFDAHNAWEDYDTYLFKGIETHGKLALDFGCGPGRNMVKFSDRFGQIDGVDISDFNLQNAAAWMRHNGILPDRNNPTFYPKKNVFFYSTNGTDLQMIGSNAYDVVFSTICMQHICVHDIRVGLLKEFHRVLKVGGSICIQMGFGPGHKHSVAYHDNFYDAKDTNGYSDTRIEDPKDLENDLVSIGFKDFSYDIRPVGPGDSHANWIFFRASK